MQSSEQLRQTGMDGERDVKSSEQLMQVSMDGGELVWMAVSI